MHRFVTLCIFVSYLYTTLTDMIVKYMFILEIQQLWPTLNFGTRVAFIL